MENLKENIIEVRVGGIKSGSENQEVSKKAEVNVNENNMKIKVLENLFRIFDAKEMLVILYFVRENFNKNIIKVKITRIAKFFYNEENKSWGDDMFDEGDNDEIVNILNNIRYKVVIESKNKEYEPITLIESMKFDKRKVIDINLKLSTYFLNIIRILNEK